MRVQAGYHITGHVPRRQAGARWILLERQLTDTEVAIVGGGIGGMVAALSLLHAGLDVRIYEQAGFLQEVGAGLQLSANASRVLRWLGLEEKLAGLGSLPIDKEIRLWNSGSSWKVPGTGAESEERYGSPFLAVHRADLQNVLVEAVRAAKPDAIQLSSRCVSVTPETDAVTLGFADGSSVRARCVVGADGVHSVVRDSLHQDSRPEFTGLVAWRGVVETDRLDMDSFGSASSNWIGPGCHVITYPLRGGSLLNFVGIVRRPGWAEENWTLAGTQEETLSDFDGWHEHIVKIIREIRQPLKWAMVKRKPLSKWSIGNVTLLGDACHATLPFLGQGAAMAIEDGAVLARCLADAGGDSEAAFDRYQHLRVIRTSTIVEKSTAILPRFQNPLLTDETAAKAYVASQWDEEKVRETYDWIYSYDATTVSLH